MTLFDDLKNFMPSVNIQFYNIDLGAHLNFDDFFFSCFPPLFSIRINEESILQFFNKMV